MAIPDGLELSDSTFGTRATLRTPWRSEFGRFLRNQRVVELELNMGKGWGGPDVRFLSELPRLKALALLHHGIRDVDGVHALHDLQDLSLHTYCKTAIRFGEFPVLRSVALDWAKRRATSLLDCTTLEYLSLHHFPYNDFRELKRLERLQSLWIASSPIRSMDGIGDLRALRYLTVAALRALESLDGIETLGNLEELEVDSCRRIQSIAPVAPLLTLRKLCIDDAGSLESLKPLVGHPGLEEVTFAGSTKIVDGDLSPLKGLPRLRKLVFQNRRHYTHRREEFRAFTEWGHE